MLIDIKKVIVKDRIRKDFGDINELAEDIKQNGLINPPVVNKDMELLAGERRLRACKSLGWKQIEVRMMNTRDAEHELNVEISENDVRKGFSKSERVDYMKRLLRIEEAKAKERQGERTSVEKSTEVIRSDDETASKFGIGKDTMRREMAIVENKDLISVEDFNDWDEGKLSTNKVFQKVKDQLAEKERKISELENRKPEVREVTREVVPADYEEMKRKAEMAEAHKKDFMDMQRRYEVVNAKLTKADEELQSIRSEIEKPEVQEQQRVIKTAKDLAAGISNFLDRYGGYTYTSYEHQILSSVDKAYLENSVNALYKWANELLNTFTEEVIE